jgi:hypothetical protein
LQALCSCGLLLVGINAWMKLDDRIGRDPILSISAAIRN